MNNAQQITQQFFIKRLSDLCLRSGLSGFPKDIRDQHILMKSLVVFMNNKETQSEKEINQKIELWIHQVSHNPQLDAVTLRRWLIDQGYITRTRDGSTYQVAESLPGGFVFDESIDLLDILETLDQAREQIERRKREYLEKSAGKQPSK